MNNITYNNIEKILVERVPEFKNNYIDYVKDQNGEHLPHILFGEFTRFIIDNFENSNKISHDIFLKSILFIDDVLDNNDKELQSFVQASFLENLHRTDDYNGLINKMKDFFGKNLRKLVG